MYYIIELFPIVVMLSYVLACFDAAKPAGPRQTQFDMFIKLCKSWASGIAFWYFIFTFFLLVYRLVAFAWTGTWSL